MNLDRKSALELVSALRDRVGNRTDGPRPLSHNDVSDRGLATGNGAAASVAVAVASATSVAVAVGKGALRAAAGDTDGITIGSIN